MFEYAFRDGGAARLDKSVRAGLLTGPWKGTLGNASADIPEAPFTVPPETFAITHPFGQQLEFLTPEFLKLADHVDSIPPRPPLCRISRAELERMLLAEPASLIALLRQDDVEASTLTFAAEIAGRLQSPEAAPALVALLQHAEAVVREGAVYGLSRQRLEGDTLQALRATAEQDANADVREAAASLLEDA